MSNQKIDLQKIDIYLATEDVPRASLTNKLELLSKYFKKLNFNVNCHNLCWSSYEQEKIFKDLKYLPSWIIVKDKDIYIIDGDHLIKALKTQILKFIKGSNEKR